MNYREIIESRYNRKNWQELLFDIFRNKAQFWQQPQRVPVDESMAKLAYYTGKITLPDGHTIAIYEVELSDNVIIERNRAGIRNLLCTNWRGMGCSGAFMFCFRQQEAVLRFSYVSEAFTFAEDGSLKKDSTDTKRFTYLLGEGHRSRTAIQQFEKLKASGLTLKDITKAFSVEVLSDLFFKEYKKQYEDIIEFVTGKRMVKVANKWEERVTGEPCREIMQEFAQFPDAEKAVRDYVKKLMGRLVFIQFLQKKGWMGCSAGEAWNDGDREFVQNLFANTTRKNTFIDEVLEPLFNDINTKRKNDLASDWSNSYLLPYGGRSGGGLIKVPYLNGGLFEHDDYDKTTFPLPAKYMKSLLDFFASYNFTIDENDPDDAEIGVDPEMLGRIFENLLEDNKDKGAFYTPKEIVQYMCRESLIAYLQTDEEDEAVKLQIREFVTTNNADLLSADLAASIDQKLKDVKICDPAIGSGAFPMGLLRELYACRKAIEGIDNDNAVRIKTHIIQNNIYGVDIEKGAVDIARLRFWLALIVDEKAPHALPNMDFKIMQGNSLLEQYEGVELSGMSLNEQEKKRSRKKKEQAWQQTFAFDEEASLDNIQHAIREYYGTDDHRQKTELRNIINSNVKSYILNLKGCTPDIQRKLENLPIPNDQFFLWHIYFKEVFDKGGFDIVIGNPPYVSTKGRTDEEKENLDRAFGFVDDLYHHFIIHGFNLLRDEGIQSMITSDTYFTILTKTALRKKFLSLTMLQIVHWGHDIFEDALVSTATFISQKAQKSDNAITFYDVKGKKSINEGVKYVIGQEEYSKSINGCFYVPTPLCLGINSVLAETHNTLITEWWDKIETSKKIAKNESKLTLYRNSLKPGDVTIIGLVTDGGQGMATGDNGRFVGVKAGTKQANNIIESRPQKLAEVNRKYHLNHTLPIIEEEIWELFDSLKSQYGNKIFGQGYLYRIVSEDLLVNVLSLTDEEKEHGISGKVTFVPYDKGDKDGNRWCLENPFVINWSKENVYFLKSNSGKKGTGMPVVRNSDFYFKGGFCWNNNLNEKYYNIKCREKKAGIHDVASMSLFELTSKVPAYYLVTLINSSLCGYFYRMFLNNTVNVQVNDLRMLPVVIPTETQLTEVKELFDEAVSLQRRFFNGNLTSQDRDNLLQELQEKIDDYVFSLYGLKQSNYPKLEKTLY